MEYLLAVVPCEEDIATSRAYHLLCWGEGQIPSLFHGFLKVEIERMYLPCVLSSLAAVRKHWTLMG